MMGDQGELFGPCIMGRRRKTDLERLLECDERAEAMGMRVDAYFDDTPFALCLPNGQEIVCQTIGELEHVLHSLERSYDEAA